MKGVVGALCGALSSLALLVLVPGVAFGGTEATRLDRINRWFLLIPALGWVVFVLLWQEWGREPGRRHRRVGRYLREPPDDPPAIVGAILAFGAVGEHALPATIVDLAQRGALDIVEERTAGSFPNEADWRFVRRPYPADLRPFEQHVLAWLFADGPETRQSDLTARVEKNPRRARLWWGDFCGLVYDEFRARNYMADHSALPFLVNVFVGIVVLVLSINAMVLGALIGAVGILSGVVQMGVTLLLTRRTPTGARRAAEWRAFKSFLLDYSNLSDAPVAHLAIWERYLVYAVALGISEQVVRGMSMQIPRENETSLLAWFEAGGLRGLERFGLGVGALDSVLAPGLSPARGR